MHSQETAPHKGTTLSLNSLRVFIAITITFLALFAISDMPYNWVLILPSVCLGSILILICVTDYIALIIPNILNAALFFSGWICSAFLFDKPTLHVLGSAVVWMLGFWVFAELARFFLKKDALGMGDIKMMAGIGAWFGLSQPISIILMASWLGLLIQFCLIVFARLRNTDMQQEIPFGLYLGLGAWFVWLFGPVSIWSI